MMNTFLFPKRYLALVQLFLLFLVVPAFADSGLDFADRLFREQDYFRAITEYKRERFFTAEESVAWYCSVRIAEAYWLSQKYESAASELFRISGDGTLDDGQKTWLYATMALNYYGMRLLPNAHAFLDQGLAIREEPILYLYQGLFFAESDDWSSARVAFSAARNVSPDPVVQGAAERAGELARSSASIPKRSPVASGLLSVLMPGAGQAYCGHWFDAFQAFATVGVFALATYSTYLYDNDHGGPYWLSGALASVTVTLHSTNVFGAVKTAGYYNRKRRDGIVKPLREAVLGLPTLGSRFEAGED